MSKKSREAAPEVYNGLATALAEVRYIEARFSALQFAIRGINQFDVIQEEYGKIQVALYQRLHSAYRNLMMWSEIEQSKEVRQQVARLVAQRFDHEYEKSSAHFDMGKSLLEISEHGMNITALASLECATDHGDGPCTCLNRVRVLEAITEHAEQAKDSR